MTNTNSNVKHQKHILSLFLLSVHGNAGKGREKGINFEMNEQVNESCLNSLEPDKQFGNRVGPFFLSKMHEYFVDA